MHYLAKCLPAFLLVCLFPLSNVHAAAAQAIAAGGEHTCALTSVGAVQCWGSNDLGQLGDGTGIERHSPVAVSGLDAGVAAISIGEYQTCAMTTAGSMKCWGYNYSGQIGDGNAPANRLMPAQVKGLQNGVAFIATGDAHTCARTSAGDVRCWGYNHQGQLGRGTANEAPNPFPEAVNGVVKGVTAITGGTGHTCALAAAGAIQCWGDNAYGQLGDNSMTDRLVPVFVSGFDDLDGDGAGNAVDTDDDGDGVLDVSDALPLDATETVDTDGDGIGNNADPDDDNDGAVDAVDSAPLNALIKTEITLPQNSLFKGALIQERQKRQ